MRWYGKDASETGEGGDTGMRKGCVAFFFPAGL